MGVPCGPEESRPHVVNEHGDKAQKDDPGVDIRIGQHVRRDAHDLQKNRRHGHAEGCRGHPARKGKGHARVDSPAHPFLIPGAKTLADDDGRPGAEAQKQAQKQPDHVRGGVDGPQGVLAHAPAHDDRVHHPEHLLKDALQENGQAEPEQLLPQHALREIAPFLNPHFPASSCLIEYTECCYNNP